MALDGLAIGQPTVAASFAMAVGGDHHNGGQRQTVVALDPVRRRVIVGPRHSGTRVVRLREVNWLIPPPERPLACQVKLRAREVPQPAVASVRHRVAARAEGADVWLATPALPAPGQACVFYDGSRVLGGGVICRTEAAMECHLRHLGNGFRSGLGESFGGRCRCPGMRRKQRRRRIVDIGRRGKASDADAQGARGRFVAQAQRAQHIGRLDRGRGAGRAGGDTKAGRIAVTTLIAARNANTQELTRLAA